MPPLSHVKLTRLAQLEGFRTIEALLHLYIRETTVPGICFRPDCDGVAEVARDEAHPVVPGSPICGIRMPCGGGRERALSGYEGSASRQSRAGQKALELPP